MGWTVSKDKDIHTIEFNERLTESGPQYVLLTADRHWDNPHSDWKLQKEHLELAKDRNAPIKAWPFAGGYGGYVRIRVNPAGNTKCSIMVKYFHGSGGGGPVTKGVIQTNRRAVYLPDADVVVTGHIHEQWLVTLMQERVTQKGTVDIKSQYHVCVPTYKNEWNKGRAGFT